jgi:hypothetical protein
MLCFRTQEPDIETSYASTLRSICSRIIPDARALNAFCRNPASYVIACENWLFIEEDLGLSAVISIMRRFRCLVSLEHTPISFSSASSIFFRDIQFRICFYTISSDKLDAYTVNVEQRVVSTKFSLIRHNRRESSSQQND